MIENGFSFFLLHVSTALIILTAALILSMKRKTQIHYVFLSYMLFLVLWNIGLLFQTYFQSSIKETNMIFISMTHMGLVFLPVSMLFIGFIFAHTKVVFSWKHVLLLIIPFISLILVITNNYHHLFYVKYSLNNNEAQVGSYFLIHTLYSYICFLYGLYNLIYFSAKNSGFFSRQSILIFIGSMCPFAVNILATFKIFTLTVYATPITFSVAVIFYVLAILKFNFLNIVPVALQHVVDRISDSFVVVNEELVVIDYNKTFMDTFNPLLKIRRSVSLIEMLKADEQPVIDTDALIHFINGARETKTSNIFETHIVSDNFNKYYVVEVTPIIARDYFIGTIILLKDVTQSKLDLQVIKEKQTVMMQERLASMGQLIGGIAHNLKTPIMSISGGIEALKDLVEEYDDSIDDKSVTEEDHHEISKEMMGWLNKIKPYCSYMSDIISTVKGQAVQLNVSSSISFTLEELVKRIDLLLKYELKRNNCNLRTEFNLDMNTELKGDVNNLVQIFDNLIANAIYAYNGKGGNIDFTINGDTKNIIFTLKDYGKGIPPEIKDKLFKQMVTTKGKDGTGLGLYISYSNIKGRFGGNMWFDSEEDKGTTFYISIPYISNFIYQEAAQ